MSDQAFARECLYVTLNEAEQLVAKFLADSRHKKARRNKIRNGRLGPQSDWETDLEGMSAEISACRLLNLYPDLQTETIPVYDMVSKNGWTIDVKTTKYETGKLLAVRGKVASRSDFYMLMIGSFPKYRCAGFASAESLLSDETLTDLGRGLGHALEQNDLLTLNEWKEFFDR